jgi:tRNA threonylcarbamoyladenosine biosynthesis protein TsaE
MSTALTSETASTSLENTLELAARIGRKLRGGEVIELVSDLGGGKTAFVKGLAAGMGSTDQVSSPSFTINNIYKSGQLTLNHFDFYRLAEAGIMSEELREMVADPEAVVVVEWAGVVEDVLPAERLTITITATGENERQLKFSYPTALTYLFEDNT